MRLIVTAAVAALALAFAGTAADAKKASAKRHTFNISCPALAPVPMKMGTCTAAGSKEAARATCQGQHPMCYAGDQKKAKKKKAKKAKKKAMKKA